MSAVLLAPIVGKQSNKTENHCSLYSVCLKSGEKNIRLWSAA